MSKTERHSKILFLIQKFKKVDVNELSIMLDVSTMTIRRDLSQLSKDYNIVRTHGGAELLDSSIVKLSSFKAEKIQNKEIKSIIARQAAKNIINGQRIFIDAGSTTRSILDFINPDNKNVIITNHLDVAKKALEHNNISVIMIGGDMIKIAQSSSGSVALQQIKYYSIDISFIGAAAIGNDGILYDGFSPEAEIKRELFQRSSSVVLLADSTKFNTYDIHRFGSLDQISEIITDNNLTQEAIHLISKYKCKFTVAK